MKAIIMAGGEGTRLKKVTGSLPKPMVPLLGKPLMERIIELLREAGISEICAALRYEPQAVSGYFGDGGSLGVHLQYRVEEEPLGTAGGVKNCEDFYRDEDFLVISGDAACSLDLAALMREHERRRPAVTLALYEAAEPTQYGLVVPEADGSVHSFIEKPDWSRVVTNLVNTGIYMLSPRAMSYVPRGEPFDFARDLFPLLLQKGEKICALPLSGYWCDVGTPRAYFNCCLDALDGRLPLPDLAEQDEPSPARSRSPLSGEARARRSLPCRDRARLMRAMGESLMEAGADFSDGLTLRADHCALRVSPETESSALIIEAASADPAFTRELAASAQRLAAFLEGRQ